MCRYDGVFVRVHVGECVCLSVCVCVCVCVQVYVGTVCKLMFVACVCA